MNPQLIWSHSYNFIDDYLFKQQIQYLISTGYYIPENIYLVPQ